MNSQSGSHCRRCGPRSLLIYLVSLFLLMLTQVGSVLAFPSSLNETDKGRPYIVEGIGYDFVPPPFGMFHKVFISWVDQILREVLDRPVTVPDRSETQSPIGSMCTI
jgi:hypothetical protein